MVPLKWLACHYLVKEAKSIAPVGGCVKNAGVKWEEDVFTFYLKSVSIADLALR